jgi:hypothetical protein
VLGRAQGRQNLLTQGPLNGLSIDLKRYRPAHTDSVRGSRREVSSTFAPDFCAEKAEIFQAPRVSNILMSAPPPLYGNYSLTIWAPTKEHCANYECCVIKQSRILPMKTMLISATLAVFLFGTAFAREVVISRVVTPHGASIVERHTAQLNSASGVLCGTKYITTTSSDGKRTTRKSVDCEE